MNYLVLVTSLVPICIIQVCEPSYPASGISLNNSGRYAGASMLYGHISSSCSHILSWCGSLFEKKKKKTTLFYLQKVAFFHEWVTIKNEFLYFSYDSH